MNTTEQLRKAAADLNNALGLEPKIGTREPKEELEKKIKKAGKLLEDGDKIEKNTMDVLLELEIDVAAGVKVAKGTSGKADKKPEKDSGKKEGKAKESKKAETPDHSKSNKAQVFLAWKNGESDKEVLFKKVKGAVKEETIKIWINQWKNGKNLPAIAAQIQ